MGVLLRNPVLGLLSAGLLGGGSAAAAQGSLPGDPLYGVKQATEEVRLAAARSDADKADLHLAFAERRASEATELAQRGKSQRAHEAAEGYQKHVAAVEEDLEQEKAHGKDVEKLVAKFQEHLKRHEATMNRVLEQVPDQAKGAIQRAMEVSRRGQEQVIRVMQAEKPGKETAPGQQAAPPGKDAAPRQQTTPPGKETAPGQQARPTAPALTRTAPGSHKDASYEIDGRIIALTNGVSEIEVVPGAASKIVTRYFGNEVTGDLSGDGTPDLAFLLTQSTGGSGTFYYVVVAVRTNDGYRGTNAVLLGDRVAPQTTEFRNGNLIVNYAERKPGEPMIARPSVGVSKYLKIVNDRLVEVNP